MPVPLDPLLFVPLLFVPLLLIVPLLFGVTVEPLLLLVVPGAVESLVPLFMSFCCWPQVAFSVQFGELVVLCASAEPADTKRIAVAAAIALLIIENSFSSFMQEKKVLSVMFPARSGHLIVGCPAGEERMPAIIRSLGRWARTACGHRAAYR